MDGYCRRGTSYVAAVNNWNRDKAITTQDRKSLALTASRFLHPFSGGSGICQHQNNKAPFYLEVNDSLVFIFFCS